MSVMMGILARTAVNVIGVGMALNRRVCASHSPTSPHSPPTPETGAHLGSNLCDEMSAASPPRASV